MQSVHGKEKTRFAALPSFPPSGLRAAVAVSCPLAYPAHQAELEKRALGATEPAKGGATSQKSSV